TLLRRDGLLLLGSPLDSPRVSVPASLLPFGSPASLSFPLSFSSSFFPWSPVSFSLSLSSSFFSTSALFVSVLISTSSTLLFLFLLRCCGCVVDSPVSALERCLFVFSPFSASFPFDFRFLFFPSGFLLLP